MVQGLGWGALDSGHYPHLPPAEALLHPVEVMSILSAELKNPSLESARAFATIEADFQ